MALIEIGSRKQFFIDDYLIESMSHCTTVLNRAEKVEHNPIVRPEHPWEGNDVGMGHVMWDDEQGLFTMRYSTTQWAVSQGDGEVIVEGEGAGRTCLATSRDGIHWEKPVVGEVEFEGSKDNNILPPEWLMGYTYRDPNATDPAKRYRGHVRTGDTKSPGMTFDLYFSPDFKTWTPYEHNPIIDTSPRIGRWGPTDFMGWDPIRRKYAVHMENCLHRRAPLGKRLIGRSESDDGIGWSEPETILLPDRLDPSDTEFYDLMVSAYEGMYVGLLWIFSTTNMTHHPEAVFSRDGIHYRRDYRRPFIERGSNPADFDSVSLYADAPIVHGGQIFTYYTGRNWRSPETLMELGDRSKGAIGLAVTRLDGFVSVDGTKGRATDVPPGRGQIAEYSELVTRSFSFTGSELHLNVQAALQQWGAGPCEIRVEVLEPNHAYIDGYEFDDADPITTDSIDHLASWKGSSDLSRFEGKTIKLRFYFKNAKLYSFQFR
jgi:hypothetical protein